MPDLQRTDEWHADRCGHVTASKFGAILAKKKDGKPTQAREDYLMQIVTERITGQQESGMTSFALQWGKDAEPFARSEFEGDTGLIVVESPFVKHKTIEWVGCSPDGLVGKTAGYESKCPKNSAIHLATIRDGMPEEHKPQVQGCMWVTDRAEWWFVSFDPRMPPHLRLYKELVQRDDKYIANLEAETIKFLAEVEAQIQLFKQAA
jgi:hypothetical protein